FFTDGLAGSCPIFYSHAASRKIELPESFSAKESPGKFLIRFESIIQLKENIRGWWKAVTKAPPGRKIVNLILTPFWGFSILIRFVLFFMLNLFSKLFTLALFFIGIIIKTVIFVFQKIFSVPLRFLTNLFDTASG
ncbi:MAG: hypothetical protein P8048_14430, partial [Calditrichia bacterium]